MTTCRPNEKFAVPRLQYVQTREESEETDLTALSQDGYDRINPLVGAPSLATTTPTSGT
jgi:hypothetical protein